MLVRLKANQSLGMILGEQQLMACANNLSGTSL